jgi:hypothetical protein
MSDPPFLCGIENFSGIYDAQEQGTSNCCDWSILKKLKEADVKFGLSLFVALTLTLAMGVRAQRAATPEIVTAIKAGHVIDVENGRVLDKQIILLRGRKIESIGSDIKIPAGAKVLDLSTKTVLPGLIDCHAHLADGDQKQNADPFHQLRRSVFAGGVGVGPECAGDAGIWIYNSTRRRCVPSAQRYRFT